MALFNQLPVVLIAHQLTPPFIFTTMQPYYKILCCFLLLLMVTEKPAAQQNTPPDQVEKKFFGLTPPKKHKQITGLGFGWNAHPWTASQDTLYVRIQGLNIELGPTGIIGGIYGTVLGWVGVKDSQNRRTSFFSKYGYADSAVLTYSRYGTKIKGLSISLGGLTETYNYGLMLNGLAGMPYVVHGVQISGLLNDSYLFKGLMIAGLSNRSTIGKGVQIGLINNVKTGQLVQIGLFNRIGNRVLPFINMRFKKDRKTSAGSLAG